MAQPSKYERAVDFTDRDGDDTDHSGINAELDAAALSVNQIRENLAKIQGDDGGLAEGVVTDKSLSSSAFSAVLGEVEIAAQRSVDASNQATLSATSAAVARDAAIAARVSAETAQIASGLNSATAANEAAKAVSASASAEAASVRAANSATVAGSASTVAVTNATESSASALTASNSAASALNSAASAAQSASSANSSATSANAAAVRAETAANNITNSPGNTYSKPEIDVLLSMKASITGGGASGTWDITAANATNSAQLGGIPAANYAVKTGQGASGTWTISITGQAATVQSVSTSQVGAATAALAVDDVGAYAVLTWFPIGGSAWNPPAGTIVTQGLNATLFYGPGGTGGSPPGGSRWMICGAPIYSGPSVTGDVAVLRRTTLFKRVG